MEKVLLPLAAAAAIAAVATPAAAHPHNSYGYNHGRVNLQRQIDQREAQIDRLIDVAARRGQISRFEARRLNIELRNIKVIEQRYRGHGLTGREYADLNARLDRLQFNLQIARRDDNRRYGYGYGYDWRW
ncbi:MAG TPA: hypothetical protein VF122_01535 [Caulobacteraceae bacterium]